MLSENISVRNGELLFAGQSVKALAAQYGTPLYLYDEERLRENCRRYTGAFRRLFPEGSLPVFAGKAGAFTQSFRIAAQEGMGVDVVSAGEIYTAVKAGFPMEKVYFHGNNKTDAEIAYAFDCHVGWFVTESEEELLAIEAEAEKRGMEQDILIRVTPGIDTHTFAAVNTGLVDSKFGTPIETGQALELVRFTLGLPHIKLRGLHCHVGSMVFEEDVYERTAAIMLDFVKELSDKLGFTAEFLDLGGGFGVRYVESDPHIDIEKKLEDLAAAVNKGCAQRGIAVPKFLMEPGRSIVADAGMTVYTVGSVKRIPGYRNYVSVDGGMTDNPRYALYKSSYTVLDASEPDAPCGMDCSLVGHCCESGDILQENIRLPENIRRGDLVAVCTTGAYNYSMASNYNRFGRPPIVMLSEGRSYVAVKRESVEDLTANDI